MLDKLRKWVCRTFDSPLTAFLEHLAYCQILVSLSLFCRCYFGRLSSDLAELVSLPHLCGRSTCYSGRLHDFSVTISRCYKDFYISSFFPCTGIAKILEFTKILEKHVNISYDHLLEKCLLSNLHYTFRCFCESANLLKDVAHSIWLMIKNLKQKNY